MRSGCARLDQAESGVAWAFVDDLNVLFRKRYVDLEELDVELQFLFDLGLADVEFLTLECKVPPISPLYQEVFRR